MCKVEDNQMQVNTHFLFFLVLASPCIAFIPLRWFPGSWLFMANKLEGILKKKKKRFLKTSIRSTPSGPTYPTMEYFVLHDHINYIEFLYKLVQACFHAPPVVADEAKLAIVLTYCFLLATTQLNSTQSWVGLIFLRKTKTTTEPNRPSLFFSS